MAQLKADFIPPHQLSEDVIVRIRSLALQQVELMDRLEQALQSGDDRRVIEAAREVVRMEQEVKRQ